MVRKLISGMTVYINDTRGNVAVMLSLILVPLCIAIGFAIDFSRVEGASRQVQVALDGAVLAAARALQDDNDTTTVTEEANLFFKTGLTGNAAVSECDNPVLEITPTAQQVKATVSCKHPTVLAGLVGLSEFAFEREADSYFGIGKLDVVFMFDTSGSMGNDNRMTDLKSAAQEAVTTIFDTDSNKTGNVRIGVSTYATSVNVGTEYFEKVTNEEPNQTRCTGTDSYGRCNRYTQVTSTCVTGREGSQKYTDDAPSSTSWIAYKTNICNSATLLPLTPTESDVIDRINSLPTNGNTAGHLGIAWSWYLLSPEWKSIWPASAEPLGYETTNGRKIAILMTDGEFNQAYMSGGNSFKHAQKYCDAMKQKKILIYTVAFKAPKKGQNILNYCATSSSHAFNAASGEELTAVYKAIAADISQLRLTR